ncbi:uncharacterized protein LOC131077252 [Cryptomeria japonica]|uniref:uncharacterized protein LOC131077252 n=1 Tax=Cryptomeria japonica TaxID=3369 RepID=UPI0027DA5FFB|nr:uncharacterized protein LOC131077252 [Cryptomeria japonica]
MPGLALLDSAKPVELQCDASGEGVAAVLMQDKHPIVFESRKLRCPESLYSIYDKEMLAIMHALAKLRQYLLGRKNNIVADALSRRPHLSSICELTADLRDLLLADYAKNQFATSIVEGTIHGEKYSLVDELKLKEKQRIERSFELDDMVYLRLQPFRQSTLKKSGAEKLKPCFYGPFRVIRRVGVMVFKLELLVSSRVHNVFHVSRLKKAVGHNVIVSSDLPPLDEKGELVLVLDAILDVTERLLRRRTIQEYFLKWKDLPVEDATWENKEVLQHPGLRLVEDKLFW